MAPYACRISNGSWWGCHEQGTLDHDSVYTQTVLEVEGDWPNQTSHGQCSTDPGRGCYAACNPSDQSGAEWRCGCSSSDSNATGTDQNIRGRAPCDVVGRAEINQRYRTCADGCGGINDQWKSDLSKTLGGLWFSTTAQGNCDGGATMQRCAWRVAAVQKTVNASCVNGHALKAVEQYNGGGGVGSNAAIANSCFARCSPQDMHNRTSDCYTVCFFETVLGKSVSFPNLTHAAMPSALLVQAWLGGFLSDNPAQGGCPSLQWSTEAGEFRVDGSTGR